MGMNVGSGGGGRRGRRALNAEINVTPFVDVMLVLLIVFMITAQALIQGEDVNLPKTNSAALQVDNSAPLAITVRADGQIMVQNTPVELENLGPQLAAILGEGYDDPIYLRGDDAVSYGRVAEVMAEVRAVGYTRLSLVTERKQ